MEFLMNALQQGGSTLTESQVRRIVKEAGLDPDSLTEDQAKSVCTSLGVGKAKTQPGAIAKSTAPKSAGISRRGRKTPSAPTQESVQVETPGQQISDVFAGVNAGHRAVVEGLVEQTQQQAQQDAGEIVEALYGMTPLTLSLAAQGLGEGLAAGHFDPERFRRLGASLVTPAGNAGRDFEAD